MLHYLSFVYHSLPTPGTLGVTPLGIAADGNSHAPSFRVCSAPKAEATAIQRHIVHYNRAYHTIRYHTILYYTIVYYSIIHFVFADTIRRRANQGARPPVTGSRSNNTTSGNVTY